MVTLAVTVPLAAGVTEAGTEHVGPKVTTGVTVQLSATAVLSPFSDPMVTVDVDSCPAVTVLGVGAEALTVKSGAMNVAVTP